MQSISSNQQFKLLEANFQSFPDLCFRLQEQFKQAAIQYCFHMTGAPRFQLQRDGTIEISFETENTRAGSTPLKHLTTGPAQKETGRSHVRIQVAFTDMGQMWFKLLDGPWQGLQEAAMQFDRAFFGLGAPPEVLLYVRVKR